MPVLINKRTDRVCQPTDITISGAATAFNAEVYPCDPADVLASGAECLYRVRLDLSTQKTSIVETFTSIVKFGSSSTTFNHEIKIRDPECLKPK